MVEPSPDEGQRLPTVAVPSDHPAAPLALLPGDTLLYAYINIETVAKRPDYKEHVEFALNHFVGEEELPFAGELLGSVGTRALALAAGRSTGEWACILWGDFDRVKTALRQSAESGAGLSVSVADTYRGVDIFTLVRIRSSGYETEIHLAVPSNEMLAASPDSIAVRDIIDRQKDGGNLPEALATVVEDWGLSDFLQAIEIKDYGGGVGTQESPINAARFYAFHATLAENSETLLRAMQQYDDEVQAASAAAWLKEQLEPHWKKIGWGESIEIDRWRSRAATVYGGVTVPDAYVPGLVQGN